VFSEWYVNWGPSVVAKSDGSIEILGGSMQEGKSAGVQGMDLHVGRAGEAPGARVLEWNTKGGSNPGNTKNSS